MKIYKLRGNLKLISIKNQITILVEHHRFEIKNNCLDFKKFVFGGLIDHKKKKKKLLFLLLLSRCSKCLKLISIKKPDYYSCRASSISIKNNCPDFNKFVFGGLIDHTKKKKKIAIFATPPWMFKIFKNHLKNRSNQPRFDKVIERYFGYSDQGHYLTCHLIDKFLAVSYNFYIKLKIFKSKKNNQIN